MKQLEKRYSHDTPKPIQMGLVETKTMIQLEKINMFLKNHLVMKAFQAKAETIKEMIVRFD